MVIEAVGGRPALAMPAMTRSSSADQNPSAGAGFARSSMERRERCERDPGRLRDDQGVAAAARSRKRATGAKPGRVRHWLVAITNGGESHAFWQSSWP
jgi:hypothetical protein